MATLEVDSSVSTDLIRNVYRDIPIGICILDLELRYLFINKWLADINGVPIEQHLGRVISEVIPEVAAATEVELRSVLESGVSIVDGIAEIENPTEPGKKVTFQHNYSPLWEDGQIVGVSCVVQDITQQRRAEQLRRENEHLKLMDEGHRHNERQLRALLEAAPDAMIFSDPDGTIKIINTQVKKLLGYDSDELCGQNIDILIPTRYRNTSQSLRREHSTTLGMSVVGEHLNLVSKHKDGREVPVEVNWSVIETGDGTLLASTLRDVSERLQADENLRLAREEASVQQERLARLVRIQTLGEMASAIAHEISQPLAAIQSYATASNQYLPPHKLNSKKVSELVNKIGGQALRAGGIVSHLRAMMQHRIVDFKPTDINATLKEVTKLAEVDTLHHDCRLILNFSPSLPEVNCDAIQIQQVVLNLIRNAMESMENVPENVPKVVTIETRTLAANLILISVEDNGTGFKLDEEEYLFDAFYTTKKSGLGMGLSICKTIIKAHGGKIGCMLEEHGGATFSFTLPTDRLSSDLESQ